MHSLRSKANISLVLGLPVFVLILALYASLPGSTPSGSAHSVQAATSTGDWSTYQGDSERSGFNGNETVINPTSAPNLGVHWSIHASGSISTQPVIAGGVVYWGSWDGYEHATDLSGNPIWAANLGQTIDKNAACSPQVVGVSSTATVAPITIKGTLSSVVFVGGGNAHFYALDASTGKVIWQIALGSSPSHFIWGSPLLYNGSVYIGIASFGDCPEVQGPFTQLNAATGAIQHRLNLVPAKCTGATLWSSPALDQGTGLIYLSTGNTGKCSTAQHYAGALVQVRASDLKVLGSWSVPQATRPATLISEPRRCFSRP